MSLKMSIERPNFFSGLGLVTPTIQPLKIEKN